MSVISWDQEPLPAWFWSGPDWLQLVSRCGRVCVARTASPDLDLSQHVEHMLVEVDVCVALEPHRLGVGGSNVSGRVVACPVAGPVALGCSWARYTVIFGRAIFFRFLGYLALQRVCLCTVDCTYM